MMMAEVMVDKILLHSEKRKTLIYKSSEVADIKAMLSNPKIYYDNWVEDVEVISKSDKEVVLEIRGERGGDILEYLSKKDYLSKEKIRLEYSLFSLMTSKRTGKYMTASDGNIYVEYYQADGFYVLNGSVTEDFVKNFKSLSEDYIPQTYHELIGMYYYRKVRDDDYMEKYLIPLLEKEAEEYEEYFNGLSQYSKSMLNSAKSQYRRLHIYPAFYMQRESTRRRYMEYLFSLMLDSDNEMIGEAIKGALEVIKETWGDE